MIGEKNYFNAILVIILIAAFIALRRTLGFIITGGAVLFILMWKLHVKPLKSLIISAVVICIDIFCVFEGLEGSPATRLSMVVRMDFMIHSDDKRMIKGW